jgi:hypothetical protein
MNTTISTLYYIIVAVTLFRSKFISEIGMHIEQREYFLDMVEASFQNDIEASASNAGIC